MISSLFSIKLNSQLFSVSLIEQEFMDKEDNVKVVTDNKSYRLLAEALKIFKQHVLRVILNRVKT